MSENINGSNLLSSGGHVWRWGAIRKTGKRVGSAAIYGEYSMVTAVGARPCRITGKGGGPALLTASGASRAAADTALDALVAPLLTLEKMGTEVSWEDDAGRSGVALTVERYTPVRREHGYDGSNWRAWEHYTLDLVENNGGF